MGSGEEQATETERGEFDRVVHSKSWAEMGCEGFCECAECHFLNSLQYVYCNVLKDKL
jgi:hypothetical protein